MPRYGAKTYGGKYHRKEDKNSQFDEVWAKSQGSKMTGPEFSPLKPSPVKTGRANQTLINTGPTSPGRHYHTRSSPIKPGSNSPGSGLRRTRSNSSADDDPFSFGIDDELAKSPTRKSSRLTRNSPTETTSSSSIVDENSRSHRTQVVNVKNKSKSSASNLDDISVDHQAKKQASILKYTNKMPASSDREMPENESMSRSDKERGSLSDSSSATGLFTDGFGTPSVSSAVSSLSDDIVILSSPEDLPLRSANHTTQGLHSYARSPERKTSAAFSQNKQTADKPCNNLVFKRKSRDLRTNGDLKAVPKTSNPLGDNLDFEESSSKVKANSQTDSKTDLKDLTVKKTLDSVSKKHVIDNKDEFDFDEELSENTGSKEGLLMVTEAGKSKNETGIVKKRSKELTGITRRIFNKKSPVKARYNARSWAMSDSLEMDVEESSMEESESQVSSTSSSSGVSSSSQKPVPSTSKPSQPGKMPALTRSVKYPKKTNHSIVTSLKCQKQDKKYFTVVKHVKQAHQCQESGESQQYSDDIEYLLDGLKSTAGNATKCLSTISLVEKSTVPSFRMHLRAHSTISRIFTALKNAPEDPCVALCTSGLMYMLSKDRLNMDLDRNSLNLLVQLLSIDSESIVSQTRTQEEREEYSKTRARLWHIVKNAAKGSSSNQLFGVTEQTLSSGFFAMESLLSLTSKRSGEWFKEELRFAGGLEHMANTVAKVTEAVRAAHTDPTQIEPVHLRTLNRCVRVLENVTFMNTDNQQYLLELSNLKLIKALASFLSLCEKHIEVSPTDTGDPDSQEANLSKLVIQGLLANLRLLLNLTHDNEWGSMKVGEQEGQMFTVLQCVLKLPQFIPKDQRFDLLVLSLGLLINLVEHNVTNARILTMMKTNHSYDSQSEVDEANSQGSVGEVSSITALTELFLQRQRAAVKLENQTENDADEEELPPDAHNDIDDWITIETEPVSNNRDGTMQPTQEEIKQSIRRALHTAGRHMEDSIVASYAALLIGCLLRENKLHVKKVRDCLPSGDFAIMVHMLKKLLTFMELTDADGTTGQRSISKVIEVLECC